MAGEVRGKVYEILTKVALDRAIRGNRKGWVVLWHEQPDWISIEADLAVGSDKNNVQALLLVTHSTSEKLSEKKFWRNFGEIFQWKVQGPAPVRVFSVIFDAAIKPSLKAIDDTVIDATLNAAGKRYGKSLIRYVAAHGDTLGKSDRQRLDAIEDRLDPSSANYDASLASAIDDFSADLKLLLRQPPKALDALWTPLRAINTRPLTRRAAKKTYVRNGLAKLMIATAEARQHLYTSVATGTPIDHAYAPKYLVELDLVTEEVDGAYVKDPEIKSVIEVLGATGCEAAISRAPARMADFIDPLRSIGNIDVFSEWVVDHFDELRTATGMRKWLKACFEDPVGIVGDPSDFDVPPRDTWLFVYCITLEKARQKRVVAYGLSNLAAETGYPEIGQGGFVIPPFVHREKQLPAGMLGAIAAVFAEKINMIGRSTLASRDFQKTMREMLVQRSSYVLSTYKTYDPLAWLIELKLTQAGLQSVTSSISSVLKELAGVRSATSSFMLVKPSVLIYWQSCHGTHVNDKTKELSARFRATKMRVHEERIGQRPLARHIFLVADGEWRDEDLEDLMRSGVDAIFYPDELDRLVAQVQAASAAGEERPARPVQLSS